MTADSPNLLFLLLLIDQIIIENLKLRLFNKLHTNIDTKNFQVQHNNIKL